jgi:hypothetical protein
MRKLGYIAQIFVPTVWKCDTYTYVNMLPCEPWHDTAVVTILNSSGLETITVRDVPKVYKK